MSFKVGEVGDRGDSYNIILFVKEFSDGLIIAEIPQLSGNTYEIPIWEIPTEARILIHKMAWLIAKVILADGIMEILTCEKAPELDPNDGLAPPEGDNLVRLN